MSNLEANLLAKALCDLVQEICMSALKSKSHFLLVVHNHRPANFHSSGSAYRTEAYISKTREETRSNTSLNKSLDPSIRFPVPADAY